MGGHEKQEGTGATACRQGCCMLVLLGGVIGGLVVGITNGNQIDPNGELGLWYAVATCFNSASSFSIQDRGVIDAFTMRKIDEDGLPGGACPVVPAASPTNNITLEESDGFRLGGKYRPIFLLPGGSYASVTVEIVDAQGTAIYPLETFTLGPDDAYPWAAPSDNVSAAPPLSALMGDESYSDGSSGCGETCRYNGDGICDDGGEGALYAHCLNATDCADCGVRGPPPANSSVPVRAQQSTGVITLSGGSSRRQLEGQAQQIDGQWQQIDGQGHLWSSGPGAQLASTAAAGSAADPLDDLSPARPSAGISRQLLKGGGGSLGGRTGTVGGSRWGGSKPVSRTTSPATYTHSNGMVYGGVGLYYVGGVRFGGGRTRSYTYGSSVYLAQSEILIVSSEGYGCYSCPVGPTRTCRSCTGCSRRQDCAGERATIVPTSLDRYELYDASLTLPAEGSLQWPLTMRVHDVSLVGARAAVAGQSSTIHSASADVLISFYTADGEQFKYAESLTGGMYTLLFIWIACCGCFCLKCRLCSASDRSAYENEYARRV